MKQGNEVDDPREATDSRHRHRARAAPEGTESAEGSAPPSFCHYSCSQQQYISGHWLRALKRPSATFCTVLERTCSSNYGNYGVFLIVGN